MNDRPLWNPEPEMLAGEPLQELQWSRLQHQIRYCYDRSPYYRQRLLAAGATPDDIRSLADFRRLPTLIDKAAQLESMRESQEREGHPFGMHLCCRVEEVTAVAATSGTTGTPVLHAFTRNDVRTACESMARGFWRAGVRPGDTVLHALGLSMWVGGLPIIRALEYLGARVVPVGAEAGTDRLLRFARLFRPSALVCTPSYALYLSERAPQVAGFEVAELDIRRIICAGEPGAGLPGVRRRIKEAYGAMLYDAALGPWGVTWISCHHEEYQGMHVVAPDLHLAHDLVDPATKAPLTIAHGVIGERVSTALAWEACPVLRFGIADVVQVLTDPCPCGLPGMRLKYLGRADDMLIVSGVNIYPSAIKEVISACPDVTGEVRILLAAPPPKVAPPLRLKVEVRPGLAADSDGDGGAAAPLKAHLEKRLRQTLHVRCDVQLVAAGTLERSKLKSPVFERLYTG